MYEADVDNSSILAIDSGASAIVYNLTKSNLAR
jgi:hypothetical protein